MCQPGLKDVPPDKLSQGAVNEPMLVRFCNLAKAQGRAARALAASPGARAKQKALRLDKPESLFHCACERVTVALLEDSSHLKAARTVTTRVEKVTPCTTTIERMREGTTSFKHVGYEHPINITVLQASKWCLTRWGERRPTPDHPLRGVDHRVAGKAHPAIGRGWRMLAGRHGVDVQRALRRLRRRLVTPNDASGEGAVPARVVCTPSSIMQSI